MIVWVCLIALDFEKSVFSIADFSTTSVLIYSTKIAIEKLLVFEVYLFGKTLNPVYALDSWKYKSASKNLLNYGVSNWNLCFSKTTEWISSFKISIFFLIVLAFSFPEHCFTSFSGIFMDQISQKLLFVLTLPDNQTYIFSVLPSLFSVQVTTITFYPRLTVRFYNIQIVVHIKSWVLVDE